MQNKQSISIFSLNCQLDKNYDRIYSFLENNSFDVYCFQELPEDQVKKMSEVLGATQYVFTRNINGTYMNDDLWWGNAVFVADNGMVEHSKPKSEYYRKNTLLPHLSMHDGVSLKSVETFWRSYEYVDIVINGRTVRIGTTHFTWSPMHDETNRYQRTDAKQLNTLMHTAEQVIVGGDFNVSKTNPTYPILSDGFIDLLPDTVTHTLDSELHRARNEGYDIAVDTFFKKGDITSGDFMVHSGLSDHQGISITIE